MVHSMPMMSGHGITGMMSNGMMRGEMIGGRPMGDHASGTMDHSQMMATMQNMPQRMRQMHENCTPKSGSDGD